jgi:CheY-like chemotaxis protein
VAVRDPDLILMDIQLAGKMNGIVAAENIRVRTRIPVIYLTAYSDDPYVQKVLLRCRDF